MIDKILEIVGRGNEVTTREGLIKLIRWMQEQGLLDKPEAEALARLIETLFSAVNKSIEQLFDELEKIAKDIYALGNELASAIASITVQSITWVKKNVSNPKVLTVIGIVATDIGGRSPGIR